MELIDARRPDADRRGVKQVAGEAARGVAVEEHQVRELDREVDAGRAKPEGDVSTAEDAGGVRGHARLVEDRVDSYIGSHEDLVPLLDRGPRQAEGRGAREHQD